MPGIITVYGDADADAIRLALSEQAGIVPAGAVITYNEGDFIVPAIGGITAADFEITKALPATRRVEFAATNPNGWNAGAGTQVVRFELQSTNYFAQNPTGHLAFGLRCDTDVIATQARFAGATMGTTVGAPGSATYGPTMQMETRATGLDAADPALRFLYPRTAIGAGKPIQDGVRYRITLYSVVTLDGAKKFRYSCEQYNTVDHGWDLLKDTGMVTDANIYLDYTKFGFVIGTAFDNPAAAAWTLNFYNLKITWGPSQYPMDDLTGIVDRYGAQIESNVEILGAARRILAVASGASFADWMAFQNSLANSDTNFLVVPNGASVNSSLIATNNSTLVNFGAASLSMVGARGQLGTVGVGGAATPELDVKLGVNTIATFKLDGYRINGATVSISVPTTTVTGPNTLAGAQAVILSQSALNMETFSTIGQIAASIGAAPANVGNSVETVLRPIYAIMSCLLADLKNRKLI